VAAKRRRQPLRLAAIASLVLALSFAAAVVATRVVYADRILPRTRVSGIAVSGASPADARRRLARVMAADGLLAIAAGDRRLRVHPGRAGYAPDLDTTVARALAAGRTGPIGGVWSTVTGLLAGREVAVVGTVDERRLEETVAALAERIERRPFPGALRIARDTLAVAVERPRPGRRIARRRLERRLRSALLRRVTAPLRVDVFQRPVASLAAVEGVGRAAKAYLEQPLRLTGPGSSLDVSPRALAGVLAVTPGDGGRSVALGTDDGRMAALVDRLAERHERPARAARISAPARGVLLDGRGDLSWEPQTAEVTVRPGRPGRTIRRRDLATAIDAAVRGGRHRAPLAVRRVVPALSDAMARRAGSLIGTFTTRYEPGQPRVANIRRIARAVDGTIVAPGEQFSLNRVAGRRTRAKGYVEAPFIADGKIVPSVGGGVSQLSTTIYNAAYFAGLRIDAHQPHSLFIDRYPAGREATLDFPGIDLRWTNDTRAPVLVRASTEARSVTVSLYGANGGRRVRAETGTRQPVAGGDFSILVTRVIRYADGRSVRQPFTTRYDQPSEGG
jgi:vancomycin resistance protein YoaR